MEDKIKVLWLSNRLFESSTDNRSGTWLLSLGPALVQSGKIELGNISRGNVSKVTRKDHGEIKQWVVPENDINKNWLPSERTIEGIQQAVKEFAPNIIQVWGVEGYWGLLTARKMLPGVHLLNIQGVMSSIAPVVLGGLTIKEIIQCYGLKEILKPSSSLLALKRSFEKIIEFEVEIIRQHQHIVTQSDWVQGHISVIQNNFVAFKTERALRNEFYEAASWLDINRNENTVPTIFTSSLGHPYKGIHVLIRTVGILKKKFPKIQLRIGGQHTKPGIKRSGYERWLRNMIDAFQLTENVSWLGPLEAVDLIGELHRASVFVQPSYVESYSLALSEALYIGTPCVVAYAGAMPELAQDNHSALFFSPGDHVSCANKICKILYDPAVAVQLSKAARKDAYIRNELNSIVDNQINIYKKILISENKA
jgi:glycosyltransferase involved in cell wall biosynthesis